MQGMRPCSCACLWEKCWSVKLCWAIRICAPVLGKGCNLLHTQLNRGMWQLIKMKVEGRSPGISLLAPSHASFGCMAHLCCYLFQPCRLENHRPHFSFRLTIVFSAVLLASRVEEGMAEIVCSSSVSGFIFSLCGLPLAICTEQQSDSWHINDSKALIIPVLLSWSTFLCSNLQGKVVKGNDVSGALCIAQPWPGMARTIYGDHQRFVDTYFKAYPGKESAKGMQSALQYNHAEYFQQHFVVFLYQLDLGGGWNLVCYML